MVNEIVTNSDQQPPAPPQAGGGADPDQSRACADCGRAFVPKTATATTCAVCFVTRMENAQKENHPYEKQLWQRKQRAQLFSAIGVIVIAIAAVLLMLMRSERRQQRADRYDQWRDEQGYKSTGR